MAERDQAGFDEFTAERERQFRAEGLFDVADMYRELRVRCFSGAGGFDCERFDRGRTSALVMLLGGAPKGLTLYPERDTQGAE